MNSLLKISLLGLAGAGLVAAQAPEAAAGECMSLGDAALEAGNLGILGETILTLVGEPGAEALLLLAGVKKALPEAQKVTIFAPADEAWPAESEMPAGADLLNVLLGHVVEGYFPSEVVVEAFTSKDTVMLPTSAGTTLTATYEDPTIYVAAPGMAPPGAMVVTADIETCVGVIHVIDTLLVAGDGASPMAAAARTSLSPAMAPRDFALAPSPLGPPVPSVLTPPGAAVTPGGAASAPTEAGDGAGVTSTNAGEVESADDPAGASHMVIGTALSAVAAAIMLLA